jgi:2-polyprenyl-3-methyl-5-hydroxy-6-metoxy-1,4-benzoquinol methylase
MKTILHQSCPVCQHQTLNTLFEAKDYTVSQEMFSIVYCSNCQTAITQNIPTQTEIGRYYQSDQYISHSNTKKGFINRIYHSVRAYMLRKKQQLINRVSNRRTGKLLDIGCGTGYFLNTMQQAQWQVQGIEADENARTFATTQFHLQVDSPDTLQTLQTESFDVITLWHVLEHIHDLHLYVENIYRLLKPNSILIIAVPNYQSYDAQHYQAHWAGYDVPRHLWHFSPKSIQVLAAKHNFSLIEEIMMPFDSFYVSLLSEKYRQNALPLVAGFWHGFISWVSGYKNPQKASSVIYVLKKK